MEPRIRIKLYGLVTVTKPGYFIQLMVVVFLLLAMMGVWLRLPPADKVRDLPQEYLRLYHLLSYIPWVVLACAVLFAAEAVYVFRRFAREEALRRAKAPEKPQPPP